jgi:cell division protein ZapA
MSDNGNKGMTVHILDKEYLVACPEDEKHDLMRSADYLDRKMREIRDAGKIIGSDRIAVMAALNIAHELLTQGEGSNLLDDSFTVRLKGIQEKIEDALYKSQQIEI